MTDFLFTPMYITRSNGTADRVLLPLVALSRASPTPNRILLSRVTDYRQRSRATGTSSSGATYALATKGHNPVASGEQSGSGWARCRKHTYTLRRQNMSVSDYPRLMVLEYDSRWAVPGAVARDMAVPGETRMMEV